MIHLLPIQGLNYEEVKLLKNLHWKQTSYVRCGDTITTETLIRT